MMPAAEIRPRVARLNESEILDRPAFRESLGEVAARLGRTMPDAAAYAAKCLDEMAVHPDERHLDRIVWLARFMTSRSYDPSLDINAERLEELKELAERHLLIFLWSHKSHLDGFVFVRTLYDHDFRPQPLSFAGINMNFPVFGPLMRRSGAIFLRRSFRDDEIYRLVFRHYIDYLVELGLPLSWSIEGTRSRTGKLNPPKMGLIQWVADACARKGSGDALLVPVSISFDQIAEIDDYVAMQRGVPKRKESLGWFIGYIRGMETPYGRIYVRFAEPLALSENIEITSRLFDADSPEDRVRVQKLAFEVCSRIEHATPVNATDLVTLVLLGANGRALTRDEIAAHATEVLGLIAARDLPQTAKLERDVGEDLSATLAALTRSGLLEGYEKGTAPVYRIAPAKQLAAAYYRNTIIHYFLASAIAEVALALIGLRGETDRSAAIDEAVLDIRDLLKFEFFFQRKAPFVADARAYLDLRYPGWTNNPDALERRSPLFGHSILRSFLEAYRVLSAVLMDHHHTPQADESALVDSCLAVGEEMLLRGRIGSETALSRPLFANAVRLARHRGLLDGASVTSEDARASFEQQTRELAGAIALLQHRYDRSLGSTMADGSPA